MNTINQYGMSSFKTTLDIVNGLRLTVTFSDECTSPGDIYRIVPEIIKGLYHALGSPVVNPQIQSKAPSQADLELAQDTRKLLVVICIAPSSRSLRHHLHLFVYFLHNFSAEFKSFFQSFDRTCRSIPGISSKG